MNNATFTKKDLILYLLARIEPKRADLVCLNKIAFLTEFYFKYKTGKELSDAKYAAIDYGPVLNNYKNCLGEMQEEGLIKVNGYRISLCTDKIPAAPEEVANLIDPIIEKYIQFNNTELIHLSHETDSYKITTKNEKVMGNLIDKDLALLETFFEVDDFSQYTSEELDELLPTVTLEEIKKRAHGVAAK